MPRNYSFIQKSPNNNNRNTICHGPRVRGAPNNMFRVNLNEGVGTKDFPTLEENENIVLNVNEWCVYSPTEDLQFLGRVSAVLGPQIGDPNPFSYSMVWAANRQNLIDSGWTASDYDDPITRFSLVRRGVYRNRIERITDRHPLFVHTASLQNAEDFNRSGGNQLTKQFPVDLFLYMRTLSQIQNQMVFETNFNNSKNRIDQVLNSFNNVPPFVPRNSTVHALPEWEENLSVSNIILKNVSFVSSFRNFLQALRCTDQYNDIKFDTLRADPTVRLFVSDYPDPPLYNGQFVNNNVVPSVVEPSPLNNIFNNKVLSLDQATTTSMFVAMRVMQKLSIMVSTNGNDYPPVAGLRNPVVPNRRFKAQQTEVSLLHSNQLQQSIKFLSSSYYLEDLIVNMSDTVADYIANRNIRISATNVPVYEPFRGYILNHHFTLMETRIDFIGNVPGSNGFCTGFVIPLTLNSEQNSILKEKDITKATILSFLFMINYKIFVDKILLIYVNRTERVFEVQIPFKINGTSPCKSIQEEIINAWNSIGVVADQQLFTTNTDVDSEYFTLYSYLRYWQTQQNFALTTQQNIQNRANENNSFFKKRDGRRVRKVENNPVLFDGLRTRIVGQDVYSFDNLFIGSKAPAPPAIGTAFAYPAIIHPDINVRKYAPFRHQGNRWNEGDKRDNRLQLNAEIWSAAGTIEKNSNIAGVANFAAALGLPDNSKQNWTVQRSRQVLAVRKINIEINSRMQTQATVEGTIVPPRAGNLEDRSQPVKLPLDQRRFGGQKDFHHMSQRVAWSAEMYDYARVNFLQSVIAQVTEMV